MNIILLFIFMISLGWADSLDENIIKDLDFFQQIEMVKTEAIVPLEAIEHLATYSESEPKDSLNQSQAKDKIK